MSRARRRPDPRDTGRMRVMIIGAALVFALAWTDVLKERAT